MKTHFLTICLALAAARMASSGSTLAADGGSRPHLETRHGARQLIVDGKPFLILGGELHNSSSSSREYMKPIWPRLAQRNLNTVLAVITWELIEPQEGCFDFNSVDDCIQGARQNQLRLVILWFGSWKNGESSYQPYWVKANPQRYPWVKDRTGKTLNILSTFGDATRDADARAYGALMRHIRQVDGKEHTVLMMQVENEVGVLGDSRDHIAAANEAFAKPVPKDLMNYLVRHRANLAPELREVWAANGYKTSGTWEEVFGPGRPDSIPPVPAEERDTAWHKSYWPVDEIFMAWRYSRYVNKVAAAGKSEYDIPMYVNTWLQQPGCPRPGEYPSGGPEVQVHDVWRFGAPNIDILAPDLYLPQFAETCERFTRNGNPLFIPEANGRGRASENALIAYLKFNAIGFSPFGIEGRDGGRGRTQGTNGPPAPDPLAQTYAILDDLAPVILDNQGKGTIAFLQRMDDTNAPPQELKLGDYTLKIAFGAGGRRDGGGGFGEFSERSAFTNSSPTRLVINSGPGEYVFVGGPMSVTFTPSKPGLGKMLLGSFDESMNLDGRWVRGRRLNGDETGNNMRWQNMQSFGIYRYTVFQRD